MLKQVRFLYESEVRRLTQRSVQRALKQMQHLQLEQQAAGGRRVHEVRGGEGRGWGREGRVHEWRVGDEGCHFAKDSQLWQTNLRNWLPSIVAVE